MFKKFLLLFVPVLFISGVAFGATDDQQVSATTTDQSTTGSQTAGQYMSDAAITTKVKSELLANKDVKSLSISVVTDSGIVTLSGSVESDAQKSLAVQLASSVTGVKSVKDHLVISASK